MPIVFVGILRCGFAVCLIAGLVCEARVVEFRLPFAFLDCLVCGVGDGGCIRFDVGCLLDVVFGAHDQGMLMMSAVAVSMAVPTHHRMMLRLLGAFLCRGLLCGESPCVAYCRMLASRCLIGTYAA